MKDKIVCMGELILRLSPPGHERFIQAGNFMTTYGGSEANVAIALANLGQKVKMITRLPDNFIGDAAIDSLRDFGIDMSHVARGGERIGIYYAENGIGLRPSKVIYDRKNSSMSQAKYFEFEWKDIFEDAKIFFLSGITAALSEEGRELTRYAIKRAKEYDVEVIFDLNYRSNLWPLDQAAEFYRSILDDVDILIGVLPSLHSSFKGVFDHVSVSNMLIDLYRKYDLKYAISTIRTSFSASKNALSAGAYCGDEYIKTRAYTFDIVDRIGGGDAFAAGLINSYSKGNDMYDALEFGVGLSTLKHTMEGDYAIFTERQVRTLISGNKRMIFY